VGQIVGKGRLLVKIDDTEKRLDVESRRASKLQTLSKFLVKEKTVAYENPELSAQQKKDLEESRIKYQKAIKDFEKGRITDRQLDIIKNDYEELLVFSGSMREEVLKATENLTDSIIALKKAELELARASIKSPFPGIITELMISKGEILSVGQEVLKIVNLNTLYLKGYALESEIGKLRKDIDVRIKFDAFPEQYFYGRLEAISPEVDEEKKTLLVYVKVDNPDNKIYPGMHAEIDIEYKVHKDVLKVPIEAVRFRSERAVVFVIKDIKGSSGVADWRYVELGAKNDEEWEIVNGIQEGEKIVIEGHMTLAHQSKVRIID
jgi:RND family efflux transporter MFP subunit